MTYPANLDTIVVRHKIVDTGGRPMRGNMVRAVATKRIWATDGSLIPFETTARVQADGTYEFELPYVDQDGIHNKGVPFQVTEDVPGNPRHYFIAPVLAHGAGPIDATEALVEAPVGYEVKIQAGPVTDEVAAGLFDQDGQFKARLTGTIGAETQAQVPPLVADAIAQDDTIRQSALNAMTNAAAESVTADTFTLSQTDYVDLLATRARTTHMTLTRTAGGFQVTCLTPNGDEHVTYQFPTPLDQYWIAGEVWTGGVGLGVADTVNYPNLVKTGAFNDASATPYTTEVGATISGTLTLDTAGKITFQHYTDTRGGMWRFTRNGTDAVDISTYGTSGTIETTVWEDVPAGTYTVHAEFLGDDPNNTPTATARGWLARSDGSVPELQGYTAAPSLDTLVAPKSNRDFAFRIAPTSGGTSEFVPYHGVETGIAAEPMAVYDGAALIDVPSLPLGKPRPVTSFELVQHIYGRNPASGSTNLIEVWTTHRIHPDARLSITGRWKALQDIIMNRGYVIMGPVTGSLFDVFQTSFRREYLSTPAMYGTSTYLPVESDRAESFLFLSSSRPDLAMAFRYNNAAETVRRGQINKRPQPDRAFLEHRNASFLKHYQTLYADNATVPAGTVNRFSGDYIHVAAPGIFNQMRLT